VLPVHSRREFPTEKLHGSEVTTAAIMVTIATCVIYEWEYNEKNQAWQWYVSHGQKQNDTLQRWQ
jgi:hypothetical protein